MPVLREIEREESLRNEKKEKLRNAEQAAKAKLEAAPTEIAAEQGTVKTRPGTGMGSFF